MSVNGSFNTGAVGSFYFTFDWYRTGYDSSKNEHYIHYTLTAHNTAGKYRTVYLKNLYVNGSQVFYQSGTSGNGKAYYDGNVVTSGDMTIGSYNSAGDGSFSASFEAGVGQYPSANCSGNGSWNLDRIPRYLSSMNVWQDSSGLNWVKVAWNCGERRDWTGWSFQMGIPDEQKSYTGSATYQESVASDGKSGWFLINNLEQGLNAPITVKIQRADSQLSSYRNINISTKGKATITAPNDNFSINSNNSLTVSCSNPSGNQIAYFLDCPSGTRRLTSEKTTNTSYTWTVAQILSMLQYFPNANASSIKVGIITYGNAEYYSEKVGTLNVVNSNPVFSNFAYEDVNSTTIALTGNNKTIIKGYSNVKGIISTANKATAQNGAKMSKYRFIIGDSQEEKNYSANSEVSIIIPKANNNVFNMYAIDTRGNSTLKSISPDTYKAYNNINIKNVVALRQNNGISSDVLLSFDGYIWNDNFGNVSNEIISCTYEYKKTTSNDWKQGESNIMPDISGQGYSKSILIKGDKGAEGFEVSSSYDLRIKIKDKLSEDVYDTLIGTGTPGIAITKNGIAIMNMYDESLGGALQITGDLYINGRKIN